MSLADRGNDTPDMFMEIIRCTIVEGRSIKIVYTRIIIIYAILVLLVLLEHTINCCYWLV